MYRHCHLCPTAKHLVKREPDLQVRAARRRRTVAKARRQRHGEPVVDIPRTRIYLINNGRAPITPLRLKSQPGNDVEAMGKAEYGTGIEKEIAGLAGPCFAVALLPYHRRGDLIAEPK